MKYFGNNSFVQKTIKADSPLYRSKIRSLPKNKDTQERLKLYNLIKSDPNAVFTFYHGTSESIWKSIQEKGYFTSPKIRNMEKREAREAGLEEVFFTTSVTYADEYAKRAAGQTRTNGIILELQIPIYYCKEVSDVILGTESVDKIYNEFNIPYKINEIIENKQINTKQKAEAIKAFFINKIEKKTSDEFTIKHAVPTKFVVGNSKNSINLWKRWVAEDLRKYEEALKLFPNDKDIYEAGKQGYLQRVKNDTNYYKEAIKLFPNDKEAFYEIGKQGYLQIVKNNPIVYFEAIKLFPNDKEAFYIAAISSCVKKIKSSNDDSYLRMAIAFFPHDKDILEAGKQRFIELIRDNAHYYYRSARYYFPNDLDIYEQGKQSYLKLPYYYEEAIELFPNDKNEFYEIGKQHYLEVVTEHPHVYEKAIKLFPTDKKEFYEIGKQGYLELVKNNPRYYYKEAIQLFPEAKHEFDIAAGKIPQEQPKQACGWYRRIKY